MKKILEWLTHWPKDKVLHFALSLLVALVAAVVAHVFGAEKYTVLAVGWFAGFGKEIYDEAHSGSSDSTDWAADLLGSSLGCIMALILAW